MSDIEFCEDEAATASDLLDDLCGGDALCQAADEADVESNPEPSSQKRRKRDKPPLVTCYICDRDYLTLEGYKKHLMSHVFAEMFVSAANYKTVKAYCREASKDIISNYVTCPLFKGEISSQVIEAAQSLLSLSEDKLWTFVDYVTELIWNCLPEPGLMLLKGFHSGFLKAVNQNLVSDSDVSLSVRNVLKTILDALKKME